MISLQRLSRLVFSLFSMMFLLPDSAMGNNEREDHLPLTVTGNSVASKLRTSRSIGFDNDILVPGRRDQDYTYGLSLTFSGKGVEGHLASLHVPLDWLDHHIGLDQQNSDGSESTKIEYGIFGFTPEDLSLATPGKNDRPYAGLIYLSSTRERYDPAHQVSWQSTLTLGVMGLSIVGEIQDVIHATTDSERPQGWKNQISNGGELTARYSISRQRLLYRSHSGLEIKSTLQGAVGYITEASWSISLRAGKIHTPWISFNPELTSYGEKSIPGNKSKVSEYFFWTGISLKARAYNAFLQGQFKDSEVTYDSDEVNHGIVEGWMGYTVALADGYSFSYSVRGHTSELRQGTGDRNVVWGGLIFTKTFN